jgi:thioesterase domain-containing protein
VDYPSIEVLGTAMLSLIKDKYPNSPLALVGWSFGGILAAEVSRQMGLDKNAMPRYLIVMDSPPLSVLQSVEEHQFNENLSKIIGLLAGYARLQDKIIIHPMPSREEQIRQAFRQLREYLKKATLPAENLKQVTTMLTLSESNMLLCLHCTENQEESSDLANRVLIFSTKETRKHYGCGIDLDWSKKCDLAVIESIAIRDGVDHFKMIKEEKIWLQMLEIMQRWNEMDKMDETCSYISILRSIKESIQNNQTNAKCLEKAMKNIFYPSLFSPIENPNYLKALEVENCSISSRIYKIQ